MYSRSKILGIFFFFQAEDGIRDLTVTGVQTCALPILAGAVGWTYALTLGFALVYLGEHYLIDLIGGLTLTEGIRSLGPQLTPALRLVSREIQSLEARARA